MPTTTKRSAWNKQSTLPDWPLSDLAKSRQWPDRLLTLLVVMCGSYLTIRIGLSLLFD
tara:strand:+ start:3242 stop:3415 length:174 start_codon:yes stop_codon:yes gene_type:complete